jgi:threonine dehydrogenase-like Zn-dependent dehydrogenase
MKALTIVPGKPHSGQLEEVAEPDPAEGTVLVEGLALGVCGTDREILDGLYGTAPQGHDRLILGHESLGRVLEAPSGDGLQAGDLVVGIVRRPDRVPCPNCAAGEWDMCRNGQYTECGIKQRHGFGAQRYLLEPAYTVKLPAGMERVGVLTEPASIVAKAWEHIERIGRRAVWGPQRVLVTGAGPVGLLAAMMGVQRGLEVHVLDRVTEGPKPALVRDLGATYHTGDLQGTLEDADVVIECTGVGQLVFEVMATNAANAIVCLAGLSSGGRKFPVDVAGLNRELVLENDVVFGSVNANRRHFQAAVEALARADRTWLQRLLTRRVPLGRWAEAIERRPGDVKTIIDLQTLE